MKIAARMPAVFLIGSCTYSCIELVWRALLAVALAGSIARILLQYSMDLSLLAFASAFNAGFSIANK